MSKVWVVSGNTNTYGYPIAAFTSYEAARTFQAEKRNDKFHKNLIIKIDVVTLHE